MELPFDQVDFIEDRVACFGTTYIQEPLAAQLSIFPEDAALVLQEEDHKGDVLASPEQLELAEIVNEEELAEQVQEEIREDDMCIFPHDERFAEDEVVLSDCGQEQEGVDCLFGDEDFEKFKALPVVMDVASIT
jgi:hypothetical protein